MRPVTLSRWRFIVRIIFPVVLVILLFLVAFYAIIIPGYEKSIMERKAEMIRELTNSAFSVLTRYHQEEIKGQITGEAARKDAISGIEQLRYGPEAKDYFWITDLHPYMIMHPYRPELNGQDLTDFRDPNGKRMFVEFSRAVVRSSTGDGFVEYMWQWKDDTTRIVPKLSYVKFFEPWGWVIGTGIYLEDVKQEIARLEKGLLRIALFITLILAILMTLIAVQSYRFEFRRLQAEAKTRQSEERYRTLVEAATEGTIMLSNEKLVYLNNALKDITGFQENDLKDKGLTELFGGNGWALISEKLKQMTLKEPRSLLQDIMLFKKSGGTIRAELTLSMLPLGDSYVNVIFIHPSGPEKLSFRAVESLATELQASVLLLSRTISEMPLTSLFAAPDTTIAEASAKITGKGYDAVLVKSEQGHVMGIVTDEDIRKRVVSAGISTAAPLYSVMSAPLVTISDKAMLYEALALMQEQKISHVAVTGSDGSVRAMVSNRELQQVHHYSLAFVRHQVETASNAEEVCRISRRIPEYASSLLKSGADSSHLVRLTGMIFESVIQRFLFMAVEKCGQPPVPFVYLVMGSAGREEQTLATDQDNAIIFGDVPEEKLSDTREFFLKLGSVVSEWLHEAGFRYCNGGIMASRADWCCTVGEWKSKVSRWVSSSEPQDLLEINIFFDFRPIFGEKALAGEINQHIRNELARHPAFFIFLTGNIQKLKPPVNLFGNIQVKGSREQPDTFDIKLAMLPLVDLARLYALREGTDERGTLARLRWLHLNGYLSEKACQDREEAFRVLMTIRFRHQVEQIIMGQPPDNLIHPDALTHLDQTLLKKVLLLGSEFIAKAVQDFKGGINI